MVLNNMPLNSMLTIDSHFVRAVVRKADESGVDVGALLAECGISADVFKEKRGLFMWINLWLWYSKHGNNLMMNIGG